MNFSSKNNIFKDSLYGPVAEKFPEIESVKNDEIRHGEMVKGLL